MHRTGLGQRVDGSLLETAVTLLNYHAEGFLLTGAVPKALGSSHPSLAPYRTFKCGDGQWVFIAGANDRFWQRLAPALGLPEMADRPALRHQHRPRPEPPRAGARRCPTPSRASTARRCWRRSTRRACRPRPVNNVAQVMEDPQTAARQMIERVVHPRLGEIPVVGTPIKFSRMRAGARTAAPLHGQHTDEVLAGCGYSDRGDRLAPREEGGAMTAKDESPKTTWRPRKTVDQMVDEAKTRIPNLSLAELQAELARGGTQLLDIRDVRERRQLGHIPGAIHVPRGMLEFWLDPTSKYYRGQVDPEKRIVLYCAAGGRSALAADVLRQMGFPDVAHLEAGFNGWAEAGLAVVRPEGATS